MADPSAIQLKETDPADLPNAATNKDWLFVDSTVVPPALALKDDTGTVTPVSGGGTVTHTGALTSGKLIQGNGTADVTVNATTATVVKLTSGTPSAASAGTDYVAPGAITTSGLTQATARLLGRTTASAGAVEEISVGTGLSLSAGSLTATGGTGTVTTSGSPASGNLTKFSGATAITNGDLSGDVTTSGTLATTIANAAVTLAKIANASASSKLLGSGASGSGAAYSELTLGTNLSMSGTTLNASGSTSVVVQVVTTQTGAVATGTTTIPFDNSIPQKTEGDEYMTLAITPGNASNRLLISVHAFATNSAVVWLTTALFQDAASDALAATTFLTNTSTGGGNSSLTYEMTAGTTSATTFRVRIGGNNSGTTTFNGQSAGRIFGGVMSSSITIVELTP